MPEVRPAARQRRTIARRRRFVRGADGRSRGGGAACATATVATVVGPRWLVEDRCTSTLTRVVRGRVR
jgi:hypothetical protein